jgi:hypothetical protein
MITPEKILRTMAHQTPEHRDSRIGRSDLLVVADAVAGGIRGVVAAAAMKPIGPARRKKSSLLPSWRRISSMPTISLRSWHD